MDVDRSSWLYIKSSGSEGPVRSMDM